MGDMSKTFLRHLVDSKGGMPNFIGWIADGIKKDIEHGEKYHLNNIYRSKNTLFKVNLASSGPSCIGEEIYYDRACNQVTHDKQVKRYLKGEIGKKYRKCSTEAWEKALKDVTYQFPLPLHKLKMYNI